MHKQPPALPIRATNKNDNGRVTDVKMRHFAHLATNSGATDPEPYDYWSDKKLSQAGALTSQ